VGECEQELLGLVLGTLEGLLHGGLHGGISKEREGDEVLKKDECEWRCVINKVMKGPDGWSGKKGGRTSGGG
jgi:hypothetical protein